jgi:hypothetical protein
MRGDDTIHKGMETQVMAINIETQNLLALARELLTAHF